MVQTRLQVNSISAPQPSAKALLPDLYIADDEQDEEFEPVKKRARTSKGRVSGRKRSSRLSKLPEMPLDILFEVFSHLHPRDLLHLSRTTKALRNVLMRRSALSIWQNARKQLTDFPECPIDLSEPEYASLAFDRHCWFCDKGARETYWHLRVRLCKRCRRKRTCLAFWRSVHSIFPGKAAEIGFLEDIGIRKHRGWFLEPRFYVPKMSNILEKLKALEDNQEQLSKYQEELKAHVAQIGTHADLCIAWERSQRNTKEAALLSAASQRKAGIRQNLLGLGYSPELLDYAKIEDHELVNKQQELTQRIWNNIKGRLIIYLQAEKARKEQSDRLKLILCRKGTFFAFWSSFKTRYQSSEDDGDKIVRHYFPDQFTAAEMEPIKNRINAPSDVVVDRASFEAMADELMLVVHQWRSDTLTKVISAGILGCHDEQSLSVLHKATSVLRCRDCDVQTPFSRYWLPDAVQHTCARTQQPNLGEKLNLEYDPESGFFAEEVVKTCGLDPANTTVEDMDNLSSDFVCGMCNPSDVYPRNYSWRECVTHLLRYHQGTKAGCIVISQIPRQKWSDPFASFVDYPYEDPFEDYFNWISS